MKISRRQLVRLTASAAALSAVPSIAATVQPYTTSPPLITPIQSDKLADSIGLNIKPEDFGRSYDLFWDSVVIPELVTSGIRHARVGIAPPRGDSASHKAPTFSGLPSSVRWASA